MGSIVFEKAWTTIYRSGISLLVEKIKRRPPKTCIKLKNQCFMELYTMAYNLSINDYDDEFNPMLLKKFVELNSAFLKGIVAAIEKIPCDGDFLRSYCYHYQNYEMLNHWLIKIFSYLDRYYLKRNNKCSLRITSLVLFRNIVFNAIKTVLFNSLVRTIDRWRNDKDKDADDLIGSTIKTIIDIDLNYKLFSQKYERLLLEHAIKFYKLLMAQWSKKNKTAEEVVRKISFLTQKEAEKFAFLPQGAKTRLLKAISMAVLDENEGFLLNHPVGGLGVLIERNETQKIRNLFGIFSNYKNYVPVIVEHYRNILKGKKSQLKDHLDQDDIPGFFNDLVSLYEKHEKIVETAFNGEKAFSITLNETFKSILTELSSAFPIDLIFSSFYNFLLTSRDPFDFNKFDKTATIHAILPITKRFFDLYKVGLANRVVFRQSSGLPTETRAIDTISRHLKSGYSSSIYRMLENIESSSKLGRLFKAAYPRRQPFGFSPTLLSSHVWPENDQKGGPGDGQVPLQLKNVICAFERFYGEIEKNEKIAWAPEMGTVVLQINRIGSEKLVTLEVSVVQASILVLLNEMDPVKIERLMAVLNIGRDATKRALKPLVHPKYHAVLKKEPSKGYNLDHFVAINRNFDPPVDCIVMPSGCEGFY